MFKRIKNALNLVFHLQNEVLNLKKELDEKKKELDKSNSEKDLLSSENTQLQMKLVKESVCRDMEGNIVKNGDIIFDTIDFAFYQFNTTNGVILLETPFVVFNFKYEILPRRMRQLDCADIIKFCFIKIEADSPFQEILTKWNKLSRYETL